MIRDGFETAMVLAAGRGERMRPLTSVLPKPALPLPDGPVVASGLRLAAASGVRRAVVNTCHLAKRMAEALSSVMIDGLETVLSHESELMGTGGGLALARDRGLLGDSGSVLVVNGDCVVGLDLQRLAARHMAGNDLVTLALLPHLDPQRWSRVVLDTDGLVAAIHPPGPPDQIGVPLLYPGIMVVAREALDALPAIPAEIPEILWKRARSEGRLGGVVVTGYWREVGTPADYLEVMLGRLAGTSVIDPTATVGAGTTIENSYIGREAVVSDRAGVADTIIAEGATVGKGATVERSILIGAVEISPDEHVTDQILAIEIPEG